MFRKVDTPFCKEFTHKKEIMAAIPLTVNALRKSKIYCHGKFGHTIGWIQDIAIISRIDIWYTEWLLATKTVATALPGFWGLKRRIQYLDSHTHKPILYASNYYYGSNFIRLTWIGDKVES